ncbi:hypothetical protein CH278_02190 [Rhodococcus sp. 05-2254-5]|uniref:hypothetical protein n=1 Tax=unclassified Rhodococcus (in: high G+C Gram-positive bacteria) TaxID=192944 RepID=UPI000B9ABA42|nr:MULTISPECIES: hypothetical protein [unclassified Rhodococcus (in: high G+C Gram-positive bacteria)]OZE39113.1 hypothetical protein CH278_02190 [Rhodococcus sp. 05-2254-5]OZE59054.1 hypothetical protein CH269_08685 [Rhodococcus sp. 05-2254-1]
MNLLTPSAWEGVGVVGVVIIFVLLIGLALIREWLVLGPAHRRLMKALQDAADHSQGRESEDAKTIATLVETVSEQKVAGQLSAHVIQAIREATGNAGHPS